MTTCSNFTPGKWDENKCCECFKKKEEHLISQITTPPTEAPILTTNTVSSETVLQSGEVSQQSSSLYSCNPLETTHLSPTTGTNDLTSVHQNNYNTGTTSPNDIQVKVPSTDLHILNPQDQQEFTTNSITSSGTQLELSSTDLHSNGATSALATRWSQWASQLDFENFFRSLGTDWLTHWLQRVASGLVAPLLHRLNQQNQQELTTNSITSSGTQSELSSTDNCTFTDQPTTSSTVLGTQIPLSKNISPSKQKPCIYGLKCYRTNPIHFEEYSHPPIFKVKQTINDHLTEIEEQQQPLQQPMTDSTISVMQSLYSERKSSKKQTPCKYGTLCYRTNPVHFEQYSHSPEMNIQEILIDPSPDTEPTNEGQPSNINEETVADLRVELDVQQQIAQMHLELVEKRFLESIANLQNKHQYYEKEIEKLREEKIKMANYHQHLEKVLAQESDNRERREIEKQRIWAIPRDTPSYWGTNAFVDHYREIDVREGSHEFSMIDDLLNSTIEMHNSSYGTIYGKDPTEFIVTKIIRIHNDKLWHEYCFKKESIIQKNKNSLATCESSQYLKDHSPLTPLLDASANEYWLFHGCDEKILPLLLKSGYDPRVSNLEGMFGGGFYLAENSSKSNQYIPCTGCGKNAISTGSGCKCKNQEELEFSIILYRAILGDIHVAKIYDEKIYRHGQNSCRVRRPPIKENSTDLHDSVMGESAKHGGNRLKYREFILYEPGQAYPEYVIKFKRSAADAHAPSNVKRMKDKCLNFVKNTIKKESA